MAKAKNEQAVGATVDVKPEETDLSAALQEQVETLQAEIQALKDELADVRARNAELEAALESAEAAAGKDGGTLTPTDEAETEAAFYALGTPPTEDDEVVAVKSRHGHAFYRAGYRVLPEWTFVRRSDFEPADFARLITDRMVLARAAAAKAAA